MRLKDDEVKLLLALHNQEDLALAAKASKISTSRVFQLLNKWDQLGWLFTFSSAAGDQLSPKAPRKETLLKLLPSDWQEPASEPLSDELAQEPHLEEVSDEAQSIVDEPTLPQES